MFRALFPAMQAILRLLWQVGDWLVVFKFPYSSPIDEGMETEQKMMRRTVRPYSGFFVGVLYVLVCVKLVVQQIQSSFNNTPL